MVTGAAWTGIARTRTILANPSPAISLPRFTFRSFSGSSNRQRLTQPGPISQLAHPVRIAHRRYDTGKPGRAVHRQPETTAADRPWGQA